MVLSVERELVDKVECEPQENHCSQQQLSRSVDLGSTLMFQSSEASFAVRNISKCRTKNPDSSERLRPPSLSWMQFATYHGKPAVAVCAQVVASFVHKPGRHPKFRESGLCARHTPGTAFSFKWMQFLSCRWPTCWLLRLSAAISNRPASAYDRHHHGLPMALDAGDELLHHTLPEPVEAEAGVSFDRGRRVQE